MAEAYPVWRGKSPWRVDAGVVQAGACGDQCEWMMDSKWMELNET